MAGVAALFFVAAVPAGVAATRFLPWTGPQTPALALQDPAGRRHSLADYRGKVVLVNFWATWCDPCREELPSLTKLLDRLAGRPFAILGVNYGESAPRVGQFLESMPTGFPILLDPNQDAPRAWRVRILPESFLVDGAGRVRYRVIGELDWMSADAVDTVSKLLREIG